MRRKYNPATTAKPAPIELKASPRKSPRAKNMNSIAKKARKSKIKPYERVAISWPLLSYVLNFKSSSFNST